MTLLSIGGDVMRRQCGVGQVTSQRGFESGMEHSSISIALASTMCGHGRSRSCTLNIMGAHADDVHQIRDVLSRNQYFFDQRNLSATWNDFGCAMLHPGQ